MGLQSMTLEMTNEAMREALESTTPLLEKTGYVGYAAARNVRALQMAAKEYLDIYSEAASKYAVPEEVDGKETGRYFIPKDSDNMQHFLEDIKLYVGIKHRITICVLEYTDAIEQLTGQQILACDYMFIEPGTVVNLNPATGLSTVITEGPTVINPDGTKQTQMHAVSL